MKPLTAMAALLGSSVALAAPRLGSRAATANSRPDSHKLVRTLSAHRSHPLAAVASLDGISSASTESAKGGAALQGSGITSVSGTFSVPTPEMPTAGPSGGNIVGLFGASFWFGIDGAVSCAQASLRAGVDIFWDQGMQTANVWYQWYPNQATDYANFAVESGDTLRITARAEGSTAGSVTVEKLAADAAGTVTQTATQTFTGQSPALCQREAVWVIEDFTTAGMPYLPLLLANFSDVTFGGLEVDGAQGATKGATGAQVININFDAQGGQLTNCQVLDDGDVKCARTLGGV